MLIRPQWKSARNFSKVCAATSNCNELVHIEGTTYIPDFLDWLRALAQDSTLTVLAHNSQGFDSYLILDEFYQQYVVPEQVVNSAGIQSLSINGGDIGFKNSLCFFQMPFSNFSKAFDLLVQKKGFFPHFFNTPEHHDFMGPHRTRNTTIPKECPPNELQSSNDGTLNNLPTQTSSSICK